MGDPYNGIDIEIPYGLYIDKEDFFEDLRTTALAHANNTWLNGGGVQLTGLITLLTVNTEKKQILGSVVPMIFEDNQDKMSFYAKLAGKIAKDNVDTVCMFSESWRSPHIPKHMVKELEDYLSSGGSIQYWEGALEVFTFEITDGVNYLSCDWEMKRNKDGSIIPVPDEPIRNTGVINLEDDKNVKIKSLLLAALQFGKNNAK